MSRAFERMKGLLEDTGLSFEQGGISFAELSAYAKGIELVNEELDRAENEIFIGQTEREFMRRYADLLKIDGDRLTDDELLSEILRRLALPFAEQGWDVFSQAFAQIGSGSYYFNIPDVTFSDIDFGSFKELGKVIDAYIPFYYNAYYTGSGIPFDLWDNIAYTFNRYDALYLPFSIIDSLRSDEIEQFI